MAATLIITLEAGMLAALEEAARTHGCTVEDLIRTVLHAYLLPKMQLGLAALGEAVVLDIQLMQDNPVVEPIRVTDEMVAAMRAFLLPEDWAKVVLGEDLWERLVSVPGDTEPIETVGDGHQFVFLIGMRVSAGRG